MRDLSTIVEFWTGEPKPSPEGFRVIAARSILAAKSAMRDAFPAGMIHDPVTEIMMSVFIAESSGNVMDHETACAVSGVSAGTAKRWIKALELEDLIVVTGDGLGGKAVTLSANGHDCTKRAIDAVISRQIDILG